MILTIEITEAAYKRLKSEALAVALAHGGSRSITDEFLVKLFTAWDANQVPNIKLKNE